VSIITFIFISQFASFVSTENVYQTFHLLLIAFVFHTFSSNWAREEITNRNEQERNQNNIIITICEEQKIRKYFVVFFRNNQMTQVHDDSSSRLGLPFRGYFHYCVTVFGLEITENCAIYGWK